MRELRAKDLTFEEIGIARLDGDYVTLIYSFNDPEITDIHDFDDEYGENDWTPVLEATYDRIRNDITDCWIVYVDPDNVDDCEVAYRLTDREKAVLIDLFERGYGKPISEIDI